MSIRPINKSEASLGFNAASWPTPAGAHLGLDGLEERVIFLRNSVDHGPFGTKFGHGVSRLHVVVSGKTLIVTEAEDLHRPGASIAGHKLFDIPGGMVFRLQSEPVPGGRRPSCRPATGIAVLSRVQRRWRLSVTGSVADPASRCERLINAVEELGWE